MSLRNDDDSTRLGPKNENNKEQSSGVEPERLKNMLSPNSRESEKEKVEPKEDKTDLGALWDEVNATDAEPELSADLDFIY